MAFEIPIEADRPDDLGFFSSFVRAPVVGTIMWLFGGEEAKKLEAEERIEVADTVVEKVAVGVGVESGEASCMEGLKTTSLGEVSNPSCVDSDVSDGDYDSVPSSSCSSDSTSIRHVEGIPGPGSLHLLRQSRLSWSDESGRNLVEYLDVSQANIHEPPSSESAFPVKSAMKRTRSITPNKNLNQLAGASSTEGTIAGNCGGELVMPSGGGNGCGNGYISPQWGWYISTTPPTPEMYHSQSHVQHSGIKTTTTGNASGVHLHQPMMLLPSSGPSLSPSFVTSKRTRAITLDNAQHLQQQQQQQQLPHSQKQIAFTKNATGMRSNMGWPSVPL